MLLWLAIKLALARQRRSPFYFKMLFPSQNAIKHNTSFHWVQKKDRIPLWYSLLVDKLLSKSLFWEHLLTKIYLLKFHRLRSSAHYWGTTQVCFFFFFLDMLFSNVNSSIHLKLNSSTIWNSLLCNFQGGKFVCSPPCPNLPPHMSTRLFSWHV